MWFHVLFLLTLPWWRTVSSSSVSLSRWRLLLETLSSLNSSRTTKRQISVSSKARILQSTPGYISNPPPGFDPPKCPPAIIPFGGITRALSQGLKVYVYSGTIPRRRGQQKWSTARSAGTDWSVSRGVDSSVWKSSDGFNSSHIDRDVCDITLSFVLLVEEKHWNSFMCVLDEIKGLEIWPFELFWLQSWLFGKKTLWSLRNK